MNLTVNPFVYVTNITNVPENATVGVPLKLTGTVEPSNATNQSIVWSIVNPGTANGDVISNIDEYDFYATAAGTSVIMASIASGTSVCPDNYTKVFYITVTNTNSIETPNALLTSIYPNPTDGIFTLEFEKSGEHTVIITDIAGKTLLRQPVTGQIAQMDISHYPAGVYLLIIDNGKQQTTTRIVKNKF